MDAKKEQIADAFQKHFNHFGYKKTSVGDIARELKISKKTIYQHFSTKEEIFYYVVSRIARQYRDRMANKLADLTTCQEKIGLLIHMIFAESRPWLKQNDAFEFKYKYDIAGLAFQDAYGELVKALLQEGVESGELDPLPVDVTVRFIQGVISESMKLLAANPELELEGETTQAVLKLVQ
jgi:AcrR family transcriptional regulator